jgi:sugar lactone lactonase YvrE
MIRSISAVILVAACMAFPRYLPAEDKGNEELFVAKPLTEKNSFTTGIEGPACDSAGNLYVVNLKKRGDIAVITPEGKVEVFVELPGMSVGNGIVFDRKGMMYVADYKGHNILRIDPKTKKIDALAHDPTMSQPNDVAIAPNGTIYASDPDWSKNTGRLWKAGADGKMINLAAGLGTANGIEVSPDGKTLYVNESVQRNVWAFPIKEDGTLGGKKLLKQFEDHGFDGMRCDVDGNIYITRYGKGTVVKLSPMGEILKEIDVLGKQPSNICFGGPDGRTAYVTEVEHRRVVHFRVDKPGQAWAFLKAKE